ncbi:unnamed protein product, partial [Rotaria sp. Silwood1]
MPSGIFVDEAGTLYVADAPNHQIQIWYNEASSGVTVAGTGISGSSLSQLFMPMGVVVDSNGYMYIMDSGNRRILRWPPNSDSGECIVACTGFTVNTVDTFNLALAIAFDSYGSIFISDTGSNRVQKFQILDSFGPTSTTTSTSTTTAIVLTTTTTTTAITTITTITTVTTTTAITTITTITTTTAITTIPTTTSSSLQIPSVASIPRPTAVIISITVL